VSIKSNNKSWLAIAGGFAGGIAASTCCILPLVLFSLGISGAWIGNLTDMAIYQPYFVAVSFIFLTVGYYYVYGKEKDCEEDELCERSISDKTIKVSLWATTILIIIASLFPYIVPMLIGD